MRWQDKDTSQSAWNGSLDAKDRGRKDLLRDAGHGSDNKRLRCQVCVPQNTRVSA